MGRKPIGRKAMTAAERQRRRPKRLRKEKLKVGRKAEQERALLKEAEHYIPAPPGVTRWVRVQVGDRQIWQPTTQPLPSMAWWHLRDEDLRSLLQQAARELEGRATAGRRETAGGSLRSCGLTVIWPDLAEEERRELVEQFREEIEALLAAARPSRPKPAAKPKDPGRPRKAKGE